jgi:hypothetical protein
MTQLAETGKDQLSTYPDDFQEWVRRKVSVMELASLAATLYEAGDAASVVPRAVRLIYECWQSLKQE